VEELESGEEKARTPPVPEPSLGARINKAQSEQGDGRGGGSGDPQPPGRESGFSPRVLSAGGGQKE